MLARRAFIPLGLLLSLTCAAGPLRAQPHAAAVSGALGRFPIDLEHPEKTIPSDRERNADPLQFGYWLQDVTEDAEKASARGDHAAAAHYYVALALAVPDRAIGFVKACEEEEAAGKIDEAIDSCGRALLRDGLRVQDYVRFVGLVLSKPGELREKDVSALHAVLEHMKAEPAGREAAADLECQMGTRLSDAALLEECTTSLSAHAPDDARTLSYEWALALTQHRYADASLLALRAKGAGVPAANVDAMNRATRDDRWRLWLARGLSVAGTSVFVALAGFVGWKRLRRRIVSVQIPFGRI
jgi:hypothetical protein